MVSFLPLQQIILYRKNTQALQAGEAYREEREDL
jgi:hypothetical protein